MNVVAIDLGGTKIAAALAGPRGALRQRTESPTDTSSSEGPIEQIVQMSKTFGNVGAVGVAVPGLVRRDGTVWAPNLPGWDRVPLARLLQRRLRVPVVVESDRNAAVVGESWRGAARGKSDVIALILGTGIGAGILSGGMLVRGAHELSGCAGWMVVTEEKNDFTRRSGSLEALAAGPAIARAAGVETAVDAADRARSGNARTKEVFVRAARHLGRAVANLVSLFDPEVIVLTGGLTNAADLFLDETRRVARDFAQPLSFPNVEIVVSSLGTEANLLGCVRLGLENS